MSSPVCEGIEVRKALLRLRRVCFTKVGLSSTTCWCVGSGPDGKNISCSEARLPQAIDMLGREG